MSANGKRTECVYRMENNQLKPYDGYCDYSIVTKYFRQVGNEQEGGCAFEVNLANVPGNTTKISIIFILICYI